MPDAPEHEGNRSLIHQLMDKHAERIRQFITHRSGPEILKRTSIEDVYQETVAAALTSANNFVFQDDKRFLGWIFTIARRVISQTLSSRRHEPNMIRIKRPESSGVGVSDEQIQANIRTPSSVAAEYERKSELTTAMESLPDHYQEVIRLYKLKGHSLDEVAKIMGRTRGATARLIGRATESLRKKMITHDLF